MELSKTKSESLFFEHASFVVAVERERERENAFTRYLPKKFKKIFLLVPFNF